MGFAAEVVGAAAAGVAGVVELGEQATTVTASRQLAPLTRSLRPFLMT